MSEMANVQNILILCTGNSCRSVLAEAYINSLPERRFRAFSAGSAPTGSVNPMALETLRVAGISTEALRSKSWDEFSRPDAPTMDFVFTVCSNAAGEVCPVWLGTPMSAHWPFPDPAEFAGDEEATRTHFGEVFEQIAKRIDRFCALPFDALEGPTLKKKLAALGQLGNAV
ncbi:MAG: arsenate reductase ArsC [Parvibaculaceae bacterium]|nr:arsenate reductase ArsC [Parvibaculaceae bacterium]